MITSGKSGFAVVLASVAILSINGCKVDQEKEVSTYRQVLERGTGPATRPAEGQPLTLREALRLANWHNERLALEGENYLQALIAKDRAFAAFLPTISLAPTYFAHDKTSKTSSGTSGAVTSSAQRHRLDVPVNGQMNLFNG